MGLVALGGRVGTTCSFFRVLVGQAGGLRAYHRKASPPRRTLTKFPAEQFEAFFCKPLGFTPMTPPRRSSDYLTNQAADPQIAQASVLDPACRQPTNRSAKRQSMHSNQPIHSQSTVQ